MLVNFAKAVKVLQDWENIGSYRLEDQLLARDAIRGSILEFKERGEVVDTYRLDFPAIISRTIGRLSKLPDSVKPIPALPLCATKGIGWGSYGWKYDLKIPRAAIDSGAVLLDTAEGYGFGKVEERLGEALAGYPRGTTLITTKVARTHLRRDSVRNAAERSLKRLRIEMIDLYLIHWPHPDVPFSETLGAMVKLQEEGLIRHIGVSNFSLDHLIAAQLICPNIAAIELRATGNELIGIRDLILPYCQEAGITVIGHSPFGQTKPVDPRKVLNNLTSRGIIPIPGSNSVEHVKLNLKGV